MKKEINCVSSDYTCQTFSSAEKRIPCQWSLGRLYLKKKLSYLMSGLAERRLCNGVGGGGVGDEEESKMMADLGLNPVHHLIGEGNETYISVTSLLLFTR